jgi:hypothetical protein
LRHLQKATELPIFQLPNATVDRRRWRGECIV